MGQEPNPLRYRRSIYVLDIGGSGVKQASFYYDRHGTEMNESRRKDLGVPDWGNFENWLAARTQISEEIIAISCAGFVGPPDGVVRLCRAADWYDKDIAGDFRAAFDRTVVVLNDAEAHLAAHRDIAPHPQMCLALGTAPGFALSDADGRISRTAAGTNFDIGEMTISTRDENKKVYYLLGTDGLADLERRMGAAAGRRHYGHRLGAFLANLCSIFQPASVILSGGIAERHWDTFSPTLLREFGDQVPSWMPLPRVILSPYGKDAALWGMARQAVEYF